ncbi:hypothetical protein D3C86_937760 [compost metagenome]
MAEPDVSLSLSQIVEAVRSGQRPSYEDLRYAICALVALSVFDSQALQRLAEAEKEGKRAFMTSSADWQWREHFDRRKRALDQPPKAYVGWGNDPDNPEFLERRAQAVRLVEKLFQRKGS